MSEMKNKRFNNIIPIGHAYASMPIGFSSRLVAHFEQLPKRPPKHAIALLLLLCDWTQRNNGYNDNQSEIIGVEVSVRELAKEIGAKNSKTINNGLQWLKRNDWIMIENGSNQTRKTVVTVKLDRVRQFVQSNQDKPPNYDYQQQEWENVLTKLKNRCVKS